MKAQHGALLVALTYFLSAAVIAGQETPAQAQKLGSGDHALAVRVGDLERHYTVHIPPRYENRRSIPVVMMFHGAGGTAKGAIRQTGWTAKADEAGFLVVFPEATPPDPRKPARFRGNPQIWNDGSGRGHAGRRNIDDVGFVSALIDDLASRFAVDPERIYVTGFSNGASMAFRLGAELSSRIAAIAPASGHLWLKEPRLERPVPLIYIIGTEDPLNPLEGGEVSAPRGRARSRKPPVRDSVLAWAKLDGCRLEPAVLYDKDEVKGIAYAPCNGGSEVLFYTIEGMGHTWPGGKSRLPEWMVGKTSDKIKATDLIWEFFEKHPMK